MAVKIAGGITRKEKESFMQVFNTVYQLAAQDRLMQIVGALGQTGLFDEQVSQISQIQSRPAFEKFISNLPSNADIEKTIKQKIVEEYNGIESAVAKVEEQRKQALENPSIDYVEFGAALVQELGKKFRARLPMPDARPREKFDAYKARLEDTVADLLQPRLMPSKNGSVRLGDSLKIVKMAGVNLDDGAIEEAYYYGGGISDIPLNSVGELVEIASDDRYIVRFNAGEEKDWQIHPDEIKQTGANKYAQLLEEFGNAKQVAAAIVKEIGLEHARGNINKVFDGKLLEAASLLSRKFNLSASQIKAIQQGKDFEYKVPDIRETPENLPLDRISVLAFRALTHKADAQIERPENAISDEASFMQYVLDAAKLIRKDDAALSLVKEQMNTLAILLEKEYSVVKRRYIQQQNAKAQTLGNVLGDAIESWLDRSREDGVLGVKFSFDRALLYNDTDIYTAEPFSPPSEELHRVLKLETGNGCQYAKCTYCTEYGKAHFFIRSPEEFEEHIRQVKGKMGKDISNVERIFLAGGNIFALPTEKLIKYVDAARKAFDRHIHNQYDDRMRIRRIAAFTRTEGLLNKSVKEMDELVKHGLNMVFWGIESGADSVLRYVNKGDTHEKMVMAGQKMPNTQMQVSVMVMTGLGGLKHYADHVAETARLLNEIKPRFITFMTINAQPHSEYARIIAEEQARGENMPLTPEMVVEQMYDMISLLDDRYFINTGRHCLIASYRLPVERIAENPLEFRGQLEYQDKWRILQKLRDYFAQNNVQPSPLIPIFDFNKDSQLRELAKKNPEKIIVPEVRRDLAEELLEELVETEER